MENELYEVLQNYRSALESTLDRLEAVEEKNRQLEEEVQQLNSTLFKEILEPAQMALDNSMKEDRFDEFSNTYGEKLGPIADQVNAIEGEGSDFMRDAFENYEGLKADENGEKTSQDDFVETLVAETQKKIDAIREAVGAEKVSVEVDENGDTEVKADGEDITEEVTNDNGELKTEEEIKEDVTPPVEEEAEEVELDENGEPLDNPEEVAELEKQLEEELKKFK